MVRETPSGGVGGGETPPVAGGGGGAACEGGGGCRYSKLHDSSCIPTDISCTLTSECHM